MLVKQISTMLNEVYGELVGETNLISEDLSNIVDVGREITKTSAFGDDFENYIGKLVDRIGKVVYMDRSYTSQAPKILKDGWEYGSILEKVRCDVPDFQDNKEWELSEDTQFDIFSFNPPDADAKFFNKKTTFQIKISITKKQLKSAFSSASEMNKFISMIENRIAMKMTLATDALIMRTIVNLIAERISDSNSNGVVNLLDVYKTATGDTALTADKALANKDFLRIASKTIMTYKKLMSIPSQLYNDGTYVTFTPEANLKAVFAADFDLALKTSLYADTYNEEFVKLDGYSSVAYWQAPEHRLMINAKPASKGSEGDAVEQDGIVAILFDERAAAVCNEEPDVRSIYNPEGNFFNYWYSFDASYMNDTVENCIVFTITP